MKIRYLMMVMKSSLCVSLSFPPGSRDNIMEVWRNASVKHRLNLPEQQKESAVIFSSVLLLPEVPHTHMHTHKHSLSICVLFFLVFDPFVLVVFVCVRGRSCGVCVWTLVKWVSGTLRTLANHFTAWLCRTAPDVTAWSKLKTRLLHSTRAHTSIFKSH